MGTVPDDGTDEDGDMMKKKRTLLRDDIKLIFGFSNSTLGRLCADWGLGYDLGPNDGTGRKPRLYNEGEVRAALSRKAKVKAGVRAEQKKVREMTKKKAATTQKATAPPQERNWSSGGGQAATGIEVKPFEQRKSTGRRYYPKPGDSAILDFAERSGSNAEALL